MAKWFLFLIVLSAISAIEGSRILVSAPFGTKSHKNMYVPLVRELVERGHKVTVITNYFTSDFLELDNVYEIVLDQLACDMSAYPNVFDNLLSSSWNLGMTSMLLQSMIELPSKVTETLYTDPRVKEIIANDYFDLVIVSQPLYVASVPLASHFQAPLILFSPNTLFPGMASLLGDEEHTSYVPFVFTHYTDRMNLWQRTINTCVTKLYQITTQWYEKFTISPIVRKLGLPDCPSLEEIAKNVTIVFTNSHPSFTYPRSLPPQVIEVGGIHCRPSKPLPNDLEAFVSAAGLDGFIVFGVGSLQQMEDMPEHLIQSFIKTFARLPQRVIWQWKGKIRADLPANVLAIPWLPQQDLLGHNGCRAFITHGGLNSLQEAVYHGVPILGLPFGIDQHLNLIRAINDGYALKLEWKEINENSLMAAIQQLLHEPSFAVNAGRLSDLLRDQIQTPLERAIFWTEFVMRHNGTDHLRLSSRNLTPYQRALLDVYLILFLSSLLPFLFIYLCFRSCRNLRKIDKVSHPKGEKQQ